MDHNTHSNDHNNSFSPFPFNDLSITCPEIAFWDPSSFDHVLYPDTADPFGATNNNNNYDKGKDAMVPIESEDQAEGGSMRRPDKKKAMHRDIERQRRQEMSDLYASLRSVLPAEVLKGKRSISDQIYEATKYIKHMENGIGDLRNKKDTWNLRRDDNHQSLPDPPLSEIGAGGGGRGTAAAVTVTVQACSVGVEVLVSGDFDSNFPVSRVLEMLLREGLGVVSCNYTKFDARSCYMIQSEVGGGHPSIDFQILQRKVADLVNKLVGVQP